MAYVLRLSAEDALYMSKLSLPSRGSVIHLIRASIIFSCVPPFHDQEALIRAGMQGEVVPSEVGPLLPAYPQLPWWSLAFPASRLIGTEVGHLIAQCAHTVREHKHGKQVFPSHGYHTLT